jgi:hypothetical protein
VTGSSSRAVVAVAVASAVAGAQAASRAATVGTRKPKAGKPVVTAARAGTEEPAVRPVGQALPGKEAPAERP